MKKIFSFIILVLFVTSCGIGNQEVVDESKSDFYISVKKLSDFSNNTYIKKTGRLNSFQDLIVKAQANGRVSKINVKEGSYINTGDILAVLDDSLGSYGIALQRAQNGLDRAKISYDSTKITLDKAVFDSELNLEQLNKSLQALKNTTIENIKLAETDLNNSDYSKLDSSSSLQLQKLDNTIEKLELDYQNLLVQDKQNLLSIRNSLKKEYFNSLLFLNDIINFGDELFGITNKNKDKNDVFEDYLGAKDSTLKDKTKQNLLDLISFKEDIFVLINLDNIETNEQILETLIIIDSLYDYSREFLDNLEITLNNSIESVGSLSASDISSYITIINTYQSTMQANYSSFLAFNTSTKTFINTYLNKQESTLKSIELTKKDKEILEQTLYTGSDSAEATYNKTIINSNDSIDSLERQIASAQNSLENAKKTREVTLRSLDNTIKEAQIAYNQAYIEYNKLTIRSPISGIVGDILIDLGQEITSQTPMLEIKNNISNEINISFNKKELEFVNEGQEVIIEFDNNSYTGNIYSISQVADSNLKYNSKISLQDSDMIGNIVTVKIAIESKNILIPLDIITINNSGIGTLNIFEENKIKNIDINLGEIYSDRIEIIDELDLNTQIITSYVDNFDSEKYNLKVK